MRLLMVAFRTLAWLAAGLSAMSGILVTASLFIAERAPQSPRFLVISLVVMGVFLALALLFIGIERQVFAIGRIAADPARLVENDLPRRVTWLLVLMCIGGALLCVFLAFLTYGIMERIGQGFAVFG